MRPKETPTLNRSYSLTSVRPGTRRGGYAPRIVIQTTPLCPPIGRVYGAGLGSRFTHFTASPRGSGNRGLWSHCRLLWWGSTTVVTVVGCCFFFLNQKQGCDVDQQDAPDACSAAVKCPPHAFIFACLLWVALSATTNANSRPFLCRAVPCPSTRVPAYVFGAPSLLLWNAGVLIAPAPRPSARLSLVRGTPIFVVPQAASSPSPRTTASRHACSNSWTRWGTLCGRRPRTTSLRGERDWPADFPDFFQHFGPLKMMRYRMMRTYSPAVALARVFVAVEAV